MARELFGTPWIKLEVIANDDTLQPDLFGLVEAAAALVPDGFKVLPYTTEDLSAAEKLAGAGCTVLMPWASPIGSARGLINRDGLKTLRAYFPETTLIIDAGMARRRKLRKRWSSAMTPCCSTRRWQGRRSGEDGASLRPRNRGRATRLRGRADRAARVASPSTPVAGTPFFKIDRVS